MEDHLWKLSASLPEDADVLKSAYLQKASETDKQTKLQDEQRCSKCLKFWTSGEFSLKIKPADQKRKMRRKHMIKKYLALLKQSQNNKSKKKLQRKVKRLIQLNNHLAIFNCLLCTNKTKIVLFKPVATQQSSKNEVIESVTDDTPMKEKKKKGKKIRNCGLMINKQAEDLNNSNTRTKTLKKGNIMLQLANMLKSNPRSDLNNKLKQL